MTVKARETSLIDTAAQLRMAIVRTAGGCGRRR